MNRWTVYVCLALLVFAAMGCSSGGNNPATPNLGENLTAPSHQTQAQQTHLWGFYECWLNTDTMTMEYSVDRTGMFTANVVGFVNKPPTNLAFDIVRAEPNAGGTAIEVDINVSITHPFAGLSEYDGYDVRGVFIGDQGDNLMYNSDLGYATNAEQHMLNDPYELDGGGPDGYTRWWNPDEFFVPGVLGYEAGAFASKGYVGSATLNPYKYFADGLGSHDDAFEFLTSTADSGVFTAGSTNTRNYYLEFPIPTPNVMYNYAITANWIDETTHPANGLEAMSASITLTDDIYNDPLIPETGGDLIVDVSIQGWDAQPSVVILESNVLSANYTLDEFDMVPTGGGANFSTYHAETLADGTIPAAGWTGDLWVIAEFPPYDYSNEFDVPNNASGTLAAFFRTDFYIADIAYNKDPICDLQLIGPTMPYVGWAVDVELDASASYDPDIDDVITFSWDFDGDLVFGDPFDGGTDDHPIKTYSEAFVGDISVLVEDGNGGEAICSVAVDITAYPSKNINVTNAGALDVAVDHMTGDALILYDNGDVRRYTYSSYFTSYTTIPTNAMAETIDVAENGYWFVGWFQPDYMYWRFYTPSDVYIRQYSYYASSSAGATRNWVDGICNYNVGSYPNDHCGIYVYEYSYPYSYVYDRQFYDTAFSSYHYGYQFWFGTAPTSINYLNYARLIAAEADTTGNWHWFIETTECIASRFSSAVSYNLPYSGPYFGNFMTPTDTSDGMNDPLDITTDQYAHMYILDKLSSGSFAIKHFTYTASTTTALTSFGSSSDWNQDPIRVDGSMHASDMLYVIGTDGASSDILSVFFQSEIPDS